MPRQDWNLPDRRGWQVGQNVATLGYWSISTCTAAEDATRGLNPFLALATAAGGIWAQALDLIGLGMASRDLNHGGSGHDDLDKAAKLVSYPSLSAGVSPAWPAACLPLPRVVWGGGDFCVLFFFFCGVGCCVFVFGGGGRGRGEGGGGWGWGGVGCFFFFFFVGGFFFFFFVGGVLRSFFFFWCGGGVWAFFFFFLLGGVFFFFWERGGGGGGGSFFLGGGAGEGGGGFLFFFLGGGGGAGPMNP